MGLSVLALIISSAVPLMAGKLFPVRDCQDIQTFSDTTGVYTIYPDGTQPVQVRCDMETDGGGWTVIQRRVSGSDFFKTWNKYQAGFGDPEENYWLGNEYIHSITKDGSYELRIDLSTDTDTAYARYQVFFIESAKLGYELFVDGYSGTAGDSLSTHNGFKFSSKDRDNDVWPKSCATEFLGAWWYGKCHSSNLNGDYDNTDYAKGPVWNSWKGYHAPMKETEMKIRRL